MEQIIFYPVLHKQETYLKLKPIKLLPYCILAIATCTIIEKRIIP